MTIYSGFTWICPLKMVIFHSYVSLPEGKGPPPAGQLWSHSWHRWRPRAAAPQRSWGALWPSRNPIHLGAGRMVMMGYHSTYIFCIYIYSLIYTYIYSLIYIYMYIYMGELQYFTNLNSSAIWGWFPLQTMIKYIYIHIYHKGNGYESDVYKWDIVWYFMIFYDIWY